MCGIIALLTLNDKCINILLNGIKQLQNRGYDSSGICTIQQDNKLSVIKYASDSNNSAIKKIENNIDKIEDSNIGIAHTRWATHGAKTDYNSHPHNSYNNKISLVHNGIIENYFEIKKKLKLKGIEFKSETDTEVIVNLLAYEYEIEKEKTNNIIDENVFLKCIRSVITQLEGTWGLAIINTDYPNNLYCIRHGSPLLVGQNENYVMISSEQSGFCDLFNNYFVLESNDICVVSKKEGSIYINTDYKYELRDTIKENLQLSPYPYDFWTIKEIEEQTISSMRAISLGGRLLENDKVKLGGIEDSKEILIRINNIIILGCGTSYNAGLLGVSYMKDLCDFNSVQIFDGAEFSKKDIPKFGNSALLLLSQSGETKDLHRCIKIGKDNNLFLIGVINVVDSMIAREVHCGCYLNAGREVAVASTKSFTSQCIILAMIAVWFSQIHDSNIFKRQKYIKCLRHLPNDIKKSIQISKSHKQDYINLLNKPSLFVLGKGRSEAIAKEGSLKIKEITYIHAEGYSGSSLKHGPFALLDENMPVIIVNPNDENSCKMNNAYEEIKSRNAPILCITNNNNFNKENTIILPYNEIFGDLLSIIPLQLISYYLSVYKGINPDFPKNLAKTVVVE